MSGKIMDKVLSFIGFEEEEVVIEEEIGQEEEEEQVSARGKKKGSVVSLHTQKQVKVIVTEPTGFDHVQGISDHLKNRHPVIINLENVDKDIAQRIVDFISGATYGLNGSMQKVGTSMFLFVPNNMDISAEHLREEDREKGFFSWVRTS